MHRVLLSLFVVIFLPTEMGGGGGSVFASTASLNVLVTSSVVSNCVFNSGGGGGDTLSFGVYNPISENAYEPISSSSRMQINCNKGTSVTITISNGVNANGAQRRLSDGNGDYLDYNLYQDASYSTPWGSTAENGYSYISTSAATQTPMLYAQIPAGQSDAAEGTYTDSVVVTASF